MSNTLTPAFEATVLRAALKAMDGISANPQTQHMQASEKGAPGSVVISSEISLAAELTAFPGAPETIEVSYRILRDTDKPLGIGNASIAILASEKRVPGEGTLEASIRRFNGGMEQRMNEGAFTTVLRNLAEQSHLKPRYILRNDVLKENSAVKGNQAGWYDMDSYSRGLEKNGISLSFHDSDRGAIHAAIETRLHQLEAPSTTVTEPQITGQPAERHTVRG